VGEGKKYASVADALKALAAGQEHISKIEKENAALREQATKTVDPSETAKLVKELLEAERTGTPPVVAAIDPEVIVKAVDSVVTAKEAEREFKANELAVEADLTKKFGEKAREVVDKAAAELGLSTQEMRELVRRKPALARKALGLDAQAVAPTVPFMSSVNVNTLTPAAPTQPKPVMFGATTSEIATSWQYAGTLAKQKLGTT
jgi:hypothetical protein